MSGYHAHGSVVSPDHRDTSGEDAWVRRRSLPAIAPWIPQIVKIEGGIPQDALATQLPTTQYAVDEGEILEMQPHNDQPQTSRAHSFLYSIPQWQPQSTQFTGQQPSKEPSRPVSAQSTKPPSFTGQQPSLRSTQPIPAQRTRPPSARSQGLPPPSLASIRQNNLSSPQPQDQPNSYLLTDVGYDANIPGIYCNDVLNKRIGIRPRQKKSPELRELKSRPRTWNAHLPRSLTMIIQQFMVASGYVFPHKNMTSSDFANFRNSLAHRLDLSRKFLAIKWERKLSSQCGLVLTPTLLINRQAGGLRVSSNKYQRRPDLFSLPSQRDGSIAIGMETRGTLPVQR